MAPKKIVNAKGKAVKPAATNLKSAKGSKRAQDQSTSSDEEEWRCVPEEHYFLYVNEQKDDDVDLLHPEVKTGDTVGRACRDCGLQWYGEKYTALTWKQVKQVMKQVQKAKASATKRRKKPCEGGQDECVAE